MQERVYTGPVDGPSVRLRLRVSAGAASNGVVGRHGDAWKVRVREAPERGRANEAVLKLLAQMLDVPRSALQLVSGQGARDKIVEAAGIDPAAVEQRLTAAGRKDAQAT